MSKRKESRNRCKRRESDALFRLWCKVSELSLHNHTIAQISRDTGLDRRTVKKYMGIKGVEAALEYFRASRSRASPKTDSLKEHEDFFLEELKNPAGLSYAQIMDHYKEKYPNAVPVSKSTLIKFLDRLRKREGIEVLSRYSREYRRRVPEGWGEDAEVDFGETELLDEYNVPHRVYFILVVFKASCYKFVYFLDEKFDSAHAVYGLHKAFVYFDGRPRKVIFDQDRVWIVDENFGHYLLTKVLEEFVNAVGFQPVFCRAYDPESKGRVERYVDFVKKNFLRGRIYVDCKTLNKEALSWLKRTGNATVHDVYKMTPREMFQMEKPHLLPYIHNQEDPDWTPEVRWVHKDNTVKHKGSLFDVPPGTYLGEGTQVLVDDRSDPKYLLIKDILGHVIVQYPKTDQKHVHFELPKEMLKEKVCKSEKALREKLDQWDENEPLSRLIKEIKEKENRYYKDVLRELNRIVQSIDLGDAMTLIKYCVDNHITTVHSIREARELLHIDTGTEGSSESSLAEYDHPDYNPDKPTLDDYE